MAANSREAASGPNRTFGRLDSTPKSGHSQRRCGAGASIGTTSLRRSRRSVRQVCSCNLRGLLACPTSRPLFVQSHFSLRRATRTSISRMVGSHMLPAYAPAFGAAHEESRCNHYVRSPAGYRSLSVDDRKGTLRRFFVGNLAAPVRTGCTGGRRLLQDGSFSWSFSSDTRWKRIQRANRCTARRSSLTSSVSSSRAPLHTPGQADQCACSCPWRSHM